ncbi:hypothetical protein COCMIDRAFT_85699 [Bipolaris oryzae ATCC 44560]|uniref:F-box domain-containing protein n=1 Tax=Bipolaris oryzae ATCC 44560 TaxID=930090 RepID=W6ZGE7_COCMI|nr:uncharacterized protein COCMIDRAFT_85699 [Bipolaris oryzae ATCC 44560]EUC49105.1 hypothetical protein COCMIDRAFT_85699 [Bipolaris oryzae ATCC 44560]
MCLSFLDLPLELRLMVYEHLSITTKHLVLEHALGEYGRASTIRLVVKSAPVEILRTCRLIHQEAHSYVNRLVERCQRLQVIVDLTMMRTFCEIVCSTTAEDVGKAFITIMQESYLATDLPVEQGQYRSRSSLPPSGRLVSTEDANKFRHFIERSIKYVNHMRNRCILEIAVRIPDDIRVMTGRTYCPLIGFPWRMKHRRQRFRLYARVEGELDTTDEIEYGMLITEWSYSLRYDGQEDAKALDDVEWQADWEETEVRENYVEAEAALYAMLEEACRQPSRRLGWSLPMLQSTVRTRRM